MESEKSKCRLRFGCNIFRRERSWSRTRAATHVNKVASKESFVPVRVSPNAPRQPPNERENRTCFYSERTRRVKIEGVRLRALFAANETERQFRSTGLHKIVVRRSNVGKYRTYVYRLNRLWNLAIRIYHSVWKRSTEKVWPARAVVTQ